MAEHYIPSNPFYSATVLHSATEQYRPGSRNADVHRSYRNLWDTAQGPMECYTGAIGTYGMLHMGGEPREYCSIGFIIIIAVPFFNSKCM